jgi:hypothetical protein
MLAPRARAGTLGLTRNYSGSEIRAKPSVVQAYGAPHIRVSDPWLAMQVQLPYE